MMIELPDELVERLAVAMFDAPYGTGMAWYRRMARAALKASGGELMEWCETHNWRVKPCPFDPSEPCRRTKRLVIPLGSKD